MGVSVYAYIVLTSKSAPGRKYNRISNHEASGKNTTTCEEQTACGEPSAEKNAMQLLPHKEQTSPVAGGCKVQQGYWLLGLVSGVVSLGAACLAEGRRHSWLPWPALEQFVQMCSNLQDEAEQVLRLNLRQISSHGRYGQGRNEERLVAAVCHGGDRLGSREASAHSLVRWSDA